MTFTDAKEVQVGEVVKGLLRADEIAVLRAVADRIVSNAHPEEDGRLDIAYAIARYLGLDWPAAQQPESRDVVDEESSRSVIRQLLHWGGVPVHVTGTVTTSPGNWSLIDAALTGERNG